MLKVNKTTPVLLLALTLSACASQPPSADSDSTDTGARIDSSARSETADVVLHDSRAGSDLWQRIRTRLALTATDHPRIQIYLEQLTRDPYHLYALSKRAQPFLHYIVEAVDRRGLPVELALVPMVESGFEPTAVSPRQAAGLWQFIPSTARQWGLADTRWYSGRHDLQASTEAALDYLEYLHGFFNGDWLLALAAYNAGEGTVQRALESNARNGRGTDFWSLPLPRETQAYVPKLLAIARVIANPRSYGIALQTIDNRPYLSTVSVGPQTSLFLVANMANMTTQELKHLNPCLKNDTTPPEEFFALWLPLKKALTLQERLESLPGVVENRYHLVGRDDFISTLVRP